jgi:hypothetical protein
MGNDHRDGAWHQFHCEQWGLARRDKIGLVKRAQRCTRRNLRTIEIGATAVALDEAAAPVSSRISEALASGRGMVHDDSTEGSPRAESSLSVLDNGEPCERTSARKVGNEINADLVDEDSLGHPEFYV